MKKVKLSKKNKKNESFTIFEKRIMRILYQQKIPLTYYELAKEIDASYITTKKYVNKLVKEGFLKEV